MPVCKDEETAHDILRRLDHSDTSHIVLDVETSGLDWQRDYIVGYVITFGSKEEDNWYVPVRHQGNNLVDFQAPLNSKIWATASKMPSHPFEMDLSSVLKSRGSSLRLIGHNLAFDLRFLNRHRISVGTNIYEDTLINASLLNEYRRSYSLDACCKSAGVEAKLGEELYEYLYDKFGGSKGRRQIGNFWQLSGDDELGTEYALGDGTSTYQLYQHQQSYLDKEDLRKVWDVECRVIPALHNMVISGIKVNEERLRKVKDEVQIKLDKAHAMLPSDINIRSGADMVKLFTDKGITNWPVTDKGNPSFPEIWLGTTELGRAVIAARKYRNLLNSFIDPMITKHLRSGRVHSEYNQSKSDDYGTVTGRLSSSNPNMQQIPKRNEELGRLFRSIFIPDEGMIWASVDYSQCEPRLLAHYSECKVLIKGYMSDPPIDAHSAVATAANIDRTSGKRLNQGLLTGMGRKTLIETLGVDENKGNELYDQYFKAMPEIKELQKEAASVMRHRGYVVSLLGRRARNEKAHNGRDFSYKAVNRLLQCGNADIIKSSIANIHESLENDGSSSVRMLTNIHDSIDFQFYENDRQTYNHCLKIMRDFGPGKSIDLKIPMELDTGEGPNWEIASYGEKKV